MSSSRLKGAAFSYAPYSVGLSFSSFVLESYYFERHMSCFCSRENVVSFVSVKMWQRSLLPWSGMKMTTLFLDNVRSLF